MELPLETEVTTSAQAVRDGAFLLDVREPAELGISAIAGAKHIPMRQVPASLTELPRDRPIHVLCHHGARSLRVTQFLRASGFANATNIIGGIDAWSEQVDSSVPRY